MRFFWALLLALAASPAALAQDSDAPFSPEGGAHYIRSQMAAIASLDIPASDKANICSGNAVSFFGL